MLLCIFQRISAQSMQVIQRNCCLNTSEGQYPLRRAASFKRLQQHKQLSERRRILEFHLPPCLQCLFVPQFRLLPLLPLQGMWRALRMRMGMAAVRAKASAPCGHTMSVWNQTNTAVRFDLRGVRPSSRTSGDSCAGCAGDRGAHSSKHEMHSL